MKKPSINTISLFTGGGGLDLGFSAAGYNILYSTDIDRYSCETIRLNSGKKFFSSHVVNESDICEVKGKQILDLIDLESENVDLIIGGPPCQAFSVFGKRKGLEDPRGNLVWEYLRLVDEIRPKAFVFENVDGIRTIHNGNLFQEYKEALSLNGEYKVSVHIYQMAEYGVPQNRRRVFFIGSRCGVEVPEMMPTHGEMASSEGKLPYRTVGEVLNNMPSPSKESNIPNHIGRNHSQRIISRYANLDFGERDSKTRINKLDPNRPSYTIIVGSNQGGGKGHIHPHEPREVTPRESARIQTFPDWWEFSGKGRHVIRQVGNAVPPLFSSLLATHLKKYLFSETSTISYDELIGKLGLSYLNGNNDF
jgi:DNA (cytosine-5)-methyltransferase 1